MTRAIEAVAVVSFLSALAAAQTPASAPAFEAADVQIGKSTTPFMDSGFLPGGRYQLRSATLVDLISTAWSIDAEAVFGGPSWLESDRFEIVAKAPPASTEAERALMLRSLLADRFKLVVHNDEKPVTVYALTVGKRGPQFKESAGGNGECKTDFNEGPPQLIIATCSNMTVKAFGEQVHRMAGGYVGDHPVVDLTELKGSYDITLKWSPRQAPRQTTNKDGETVAALSLFDGIDKLGLKLEAVKRTIPVIVVDSVNRTPTPNTGDVTKKLPAAMTEFEAATIKQNKSGSEMRRIQPKPGGRIEVENIPLKDLIGLAWNFDFGDHDRIVGLPKWAETDAFDIVAKTAILPGEAPPPFDDVRVMLRPLLIERFKMKVHDEDQPVAVWTLTVGKRGSKLKEADPASRSGCKRGNTQTGTGANPLPALQYSCTNTTMAQLAEAMHQIANGYVDHPAVDMTGLKGGYDFTITWNPVGITRGAGQGRPAEPGANAGASDPPGGTTFFDAVDKQLGLRLEGGQKHPMPVLVIDHVEPLGPEN